MGAGFCCPGASGRCNSPLHSAGAAVQGRPNHARCCPAAGRKFSGELPSFHLHGEGIDQHAHAPTTCPGNPHHMIAIKSSCHGATGFDHLGERLLPCHLQNGLLLCQTGEIILGATLLRFLNDFADLSCPPAYVWLALWLEANGALCYGRTDAHVRCSAELCISHTGDPLVYEWPGWNTQSCLCFRGSN